MKRIAAWCIVGAINAAYNGIAYIVTWDRSVIGPLH